MNLRSKFGNAFDIFLMGIIILGVGVFVFYPFFEVLKTGVYRDGQFDFSLLMHHLSQSTLLKNSLTLATITTILSVVSATVVAIFFYLSSRKVKMVLFIILSITLISPPFVTSLAFINLFGRRGFITYNLLGLRIMPYGMWGVALMQMLGSLSMNSFIIIAALSNFDEAIINSARSLKASTNRIILDIILPNIMPAIRVVAILSFMTSLADFGTPAIIGGSFNTLATEGYLAVIAQGNFEKAAVINMIILIPALIVYAFYYRSLTQSTTSKQGFLNTGVQMNRRGIVFYSIAILAIFFVVWISLQYLSIIMSAFTTMRQGELVFTIDNIIETIPFIDSTTIRSIIYSLISALVGSVLGLFIGYYLMIRKSRIMKYVDIIATLPYIIPGTFFGLGYLLAFNSPPIYLLGTHTIIVMNVTFKQLPFSTKVGNSIMEGIDTEIISSVRDLGGGSFQVIKDVIFPLSKRGLSLSFVNAFTATMTTMGSIIFLITPRQKVLTVVMFDAIQTGKYDVGSVIAVFIMLICLAVSSIYLWLMRGD